MRILIFNWRDINNPRAGGAETYTHEIAKQLVATGHTVTLFTSAFPGCVSREQIDGIDILRHGGRMGVYFNAWRSYRREFKNKYDFVIDQVNTIPFFTPLYLKDSGAALIFQMTREVYLSVLPSGIGRLAMSIERLILKLYKKSNVVVISESIKDELVGEGFSGSNISVVEPGLNHSGYGPGKKAAKPTVLFLNRIVKYKNVTHLIEAFSIVRREVPEALLMIGGCRGGAYEKAVKEQAEELGLSDAVEFFPFVGKTEKTQRLQSAWVNVLPSTKEGWGMSVLEAAACETPSVAYNVPGLRDAVRDDETGLLVQYGDIDALAGAIVRLLKDDDLRRRYSRQALESSKSFAWEKSAEKLARIIKEQVSAPQ